MEPKFAVGEYVTIVKSVYFQVDNFVIRSGEVGKVSEVDMISNASSKTIFYDYIVIVRGTPLFFYEDELAPCPREEKK